MSIAHYAPGGKNVLLILLVPGGKNVLLIFLVPGGKNVLLILLVPWRQKCFINLFGPWRHHPINMRPLWGRFCNCLTPEESHVYKKEAIF